MSEDIQGDETFSDTERRLRRRIEELERERSVLEATLDATVDILEQTRAERDAAIDALPATAWSDGR